MVYGKKRSKETIATKEKKGSKQRLINERPSTLSAEYVVDSDDEQANTPGATSAPVSESSLDEEEDSNIQQEAASSRIVSSVSRPNNANKGPTDVAAASQNPLTKGKALIESTSSSELQTDTASGSGSSSEVGSESDDDGMSIDIPAAPSVQDTPAQKKTVPAISAGVATEPFLPPTGFFPACAPAGLSPFLRNFDGKQIWHISVPEGISLAKLQTISLQAIDRAEPILTHKEVEYGFVTTRKRDAAGQCLVVPDRTGGYRLAKVPVNKVLTLQQTTSEEGGTPRDGRDLDSMDETVGPDQSLLLAQKTYGKLPPPQMPLGLKMRHQPIGVHDVEETIAPNASALPLKKKKKQKQIPNR